MKKNGAFLLVVVCLVFLAGSVPAEVTVTRDGFGIPVIEADTAGALFEEFGYVTAVDRLWQMEVNKRWGLGALAEIFGPKLVPSDSQTRLMGYTDEEYQTIFNALAPESRELLKAYIKGINRRVDEVLADPRSMPMEYLALKIEPVHFTSTDVFAFAKNLLRRFGMQGGGEFKNLAVLRLLTERFGPDAGRAAFDDWCWINDPSAPTYIREKIDGGFIPVETKMVDVPSYLKEHHNIASLSQREEKRHASAEKEALKVGAPVTLGSNSWTLSPEMTGAGFPILVGQPQMGHAVPSIIMEIQLRGGPFDVVGMAFPLLPMIPIGHNTHMAWSHMVGMCDNVDVYQETLNPLNKEEYLYKGAWRKMEKRTEKIMVSGGETQEIKIYRTVHGPVFSPYPFDPDTCEENVVYTKKLAHWATEPLSLDGWLKAMAAVSAEEFGAGMSLIQTSLHTTYADTAGNIGYWHTGLNPERIEGFDPRLPLPGSGEAEWTGRYLPNAWVLNPPKGFVAGWNNKSSPDTRNPFSDDPNYHVFGRYNRALWLDRSISGRNDLDFEANKELMVFLGAAGTYRLNHHNALGGAIKDLLPFMQQASAGAAEEDAAILNDIISVMSDWDGRAVRDAVQDDRFQAGQTILLDWLPRLMNATFGDELDGIEKFKGVHNRIFGLFLRCLDGPVSPLPVSRNYFDNIQTPDEETVNDIFRQTLLDTADHLKKEFQNDDPKTWNGLRTKIVFKHDMFGQVAEMPDSNIGTYIQIVELRPEGAVGYSRWPLGQSGHISPGPDNKPVFDPHFFDMQPLYQNYTYQKMGLD